MIELRRRLIVPRAPGLAGVHGDGRALVGRDEHDVSVVRIYPNAVIVVAARCALDRGEGCAAIRRPICRSVRRVHHVRIPRVDFDLREVGRASPDTHFRVCATPCLARVIGTIDPAQGRSVDRGVHPARISRRDREPDSPQTLRRGR